MTQVHEKHLLEREKTADNFCKKVDHLIGKSISLRELHRLFPGYFFIWWNDDSCYGAYSFYITDNAEKEKEKIDLFKKESTSNYVYVYAENDPEFDKNYIVDSIRMNKWINLSSK